MAEIPIEVAAGIVALAATAVGALAYALRRSFDVLEGFRTTLENHFRHDEANIARHNELMSLHTKELKEVVTALERNNALGNVWEIRWRERGGWSFKPDEKP